MFIENDLSGIPGILDFANVRIRTIAVSLAFSVAFWAFPAEAKTIEEARKELAQLGIQYNANAFLTCIRDGDKVAVICF